MSRSRKAARYGALAERHAREKYDLKAEHDGQHDAIDGQGRPWEIKSAMLSRSDPRFRLWEDQHRYLSQREGGYVFVAYVPRGDGIEIRRSLSVSARSVKVEFYGAGGHRGGENQVKIPVGYIFK